MILLRNCEKDVLQDIIDDLGACAIFNVYTMPDTAQINIELNTDISVSLDNDSIHLMLPGYYENVMYCIIHKSRVAEVIIS